MRQATRCVPLLCRLLAFAATARESSVAGSVLDCCQLAYRPASPQFGRRTKLRAAPGFPDHPQLEGFSLRGMRKQRRAMWHQFNRQQHPLQFHLHLQRQGSSRLMQYVKRASPSPFSRFSTPHLDFVWLPPNHNAATTSCNLPCSSS